MLGLSLLRKSTLNSVDQEAVSTRKSRYKWNLKCSRGCLSEGVYRRRFIGGLYRRVLSQLAEPRAHDLVSLLIYVLGDHNKMWDLSAWKCIKLGCRWGKEICCVVALGYKKGYYQLCKVIKYKKRTQMFPFSSCIHPLSKASAIGRLSVQSFNAILLTDGDLSHLIHHLWAEGAEAGLEMHSASLLLPRWPYPLAVHPFQPLLHSFWIYLLPITQSVSPSGARKHIELLLWVYSFFPDTASYSKIPQE